MLIHYKFGLHFKTGLLRSNRKPSALLLGIALSICLTLASCEQQAPSAKADSAKTPSKKINRVDAIWPKLVSEVAKDPKIENKIETILAKMTLEQKIAQMIQPEIKDFTVEQIIQYLRTVDLSKARALSYSPEKWAPRSP